MIKTTPGLLRPDTDVELPLVFPNPKDKALYFPKLMKALLRSRVIAKSPLSNASDIRALHAAKAKFETKGYEEEYFEYLELEN